MVIQKELIEKIDFVDKKARKITQHAKSLK